MSNVTLNILMNKLIFNPIPISLIPLIKSTLILLLPAAIKYPFTIIKTGATGGPPRKRSIDPN